MQWQTSEASGRFGVLTLCGGMLPLVRTLLHALLVFHFLPASPFHWRDCWSISIARGTGSISRQSGGMRCPSKRIALPIQAGSASFPSLQRARVSQHALALRTARPAAALRLAGIRGLCAMQPPVDLEPPDAFPVDLEPPDTKMDDPGEKALNDRGFFFWNRKPGHPSHSNPNPPRELAQRGSTSSSKRAQAARRRWDAAMLAIRFSRQPREIRQAVSLICEEVPSCFCDYRKQTPRAPSNAPKPRHHPGRTL